MTDPHICHTCERDFNWLYEFSPYGHDNPAKKLEAANRNSYCEMCFIKKDKELTDLVVDIDIDINVDKEESMCVE